MNNSYPTYHLYNNQYSVPTREEFIPNKPANKEEEKNISININDTPNEWKKYNPGIAPETWGSAFWFTLHNGSNNYPINPTPAWKYRMKNFILGIPVMIPCETCEAHASSYIQERFNDLDIIVSSRKNLFEFFVHFHNEVNKRLGKKVISIDEVKKIYQ
tara:strand:+ start:74 stop:550 length:477 start_codon:yes stop_codon:yes gene_type:complete